METLPEEIVALILGHEGMLLTLGSTCRYMRNLSLNVSPIHLLDRNSPSDGYIDEDFKALIPFATSADLLNVLYIQKDKLGASHVSRKGFFHYFTEESPSRIECTWQRLKRVVIRSYDFMTPELGNEAEKIKGTLYMDAPRLERIHWQNFSLCRYGDYFHPKHRRELCRLTPRLSVFELESRQPSAAHNDIPISHLVHPLKYISCPQYFWDCLDDVDYDLKLIGDIPKDVSFTLGDVWISFPGETRPEPRWVEQVMLMASDPDIACRFALICIHSVYSTPLRRLKWFMWACKNLAASSLVRLRLCNVDPSRAKHVLDSDARFALHYAPLGEWDIVFDPSITPSNTKRV